MIADAHTVPPPNVTLSTCTTYGIHPFAHVRATSVIESLVNMMGAADGGHEGTPGGFGGAGGGETPTHAKSTENHRRLLVFE